MAQDAQKKVLFCFPGTNPARRIQGFFSIFGKGPWGPFVWEFYRCLTTNWEKQFNENVSNFLQKGV